MTESNTNLLVGVILGALAGLSLGILIAQLFRSFSPQPKQPDRSVLFDRDELGLIKAFHYVSH